MARISTYGLDDSINENDLIAGSDYLGTKNNLPGGTPRYATKNFKLRDLAKYFANGGFKDGDYYNLAQITTNISQNSSTITDNSVAIASVNATITTNTTNISSNANFSLNLASSFGTVNSAGNITAFSESFANLVLDATTSENYASASQLTNLTSTVNTNTTSIAAKPAIFRQDDAPSVTGVANGSIWYDTNDGNRIYVLTSGAWASTHDPRISTNENNITSNVASLALRPKVFKQDDPPTLSGLPANSLWYDTNDNNKLYIFNGTAWVLTDDTRTGLNVTYIATANTNIATNATNITSSASKITELESQFTFSGTDINGVANALSTSISSTATSAAGAVASDLDKLEAVFSQDGNGDVTGITGVLSTAVTTNANAAIANASLASASSVTALIT